MSDFPDFDQLVKLAQDPEALETFRQEQVEKLINEAPTEHHRRLRGLQFQIDAQRTLHSHSAMGSCMQISKMMHESFADLRTWLNQITGTDDPLRTELENYEIDNKVAAKVLPFPNH